MNVGEIPKAKRGPAPAPVPQLAARLDRAPTSDGWLVEIKLDGYRIMARAADGRVRFTSRNGKDWTSRFMALAKVLAQPALGDVLLDGEVVVVKPNGATSFKQLQEALSARRTTGLVYQVFDVLYADGYDLTDVPLATRKKILEERLARLPAAEGSPVRYVDHFVGRAPQVLKEACRLGLEGIVCKKRDARYRSGRGEDWIKVKCVQQAEFLVVGYTPPSKARAGFGALVLAAYRDDGKLVHVGRVGSGFSERSLRQLHTVLQRARTDRCPLDEIAGDVKRVQWVRPQVVVDVEFSEWTRDGLLRHPVFRGVRDDRKPNEILLEQARPSSDAIQHERSRTPARASMPDDRVAGVTITHPDRVLYPSTGVTKLHVARYYEEIGERLLAHVENRPLMLVRCPGGAQEECFHQKHPPQGLPDIVKRVRIAERSGAATHLYVDSLAGIIALVQIGALEFHVWGARIDAVEKPDLMVFDLDPGPGVGWLELVAAARDLAHRLEVLGLPSFAKVTGGKGVHLVVPLKRRQGWDDVKGFAAAVAELQAKEEPRRFTARMSKSRRQGKIFIDYLRNGRGATFIAAYSTRARSGAPVAVPVGWEELEGLGGANVYDVDSLRRRMAVLDRDPWEGFEAARTSITREMRERVGMRAVA